MIDPPTDLRVIAAVGALAVAGILLSRAATWRGRRLLLSRWRRLTRWEFWPPWIFYLPVVAYVIRLGWKHRGLTVFTAANPAMPAGGFLGESKSAILADLERAGAPVARFARLRVSAAADEAEAEDCLPARARRLMAQEGLDFPLVVKPDVGQRGAGVRVVRSQAELAAALLAARSDRILQEYVEGPEFGVFYVHRAGQARGEIFSITEKRLPEVVGDGRRPLERLILADARAVCMARYFLGSHAARLAWIPAPGERVVLTEVGNHCRGALFLDGGWLRTDALEEAIDRIAHSYAGFHFGRFDVRARSLEDLAAGREFKILELNGVSSEATDIYDPRNPLAPAYRKLFDQWRLAFEIGAANRAEGALVADWREVLGFKLGPR